MPREVMGVMIKSELPQAITAEMPELKHDVAVMAVKTFFDEIIQALAQGQRVEIRGFGSFEARARNARQGRNPRTGASVQVRSKYVPHFKAGKELRERLNAKTRG